MLLYTSYVFSEHFYTSPYGLTKVLTVLQCSLKSPYTNSQIYSLWNICPMVFLFLTGLRTGLRTGPTLPIGPHRSDPRLVQPTGRCWACLSTQFTYSRVINLTHYEVAYSWSNTFKNERNFLVQWSFQLWYSAAIWNIPISKRLISFRLFAKQEFEYVCFTHVVVLKRVCIVDRIWWDKIKFGLLDGVWCNIVSLYGIYHLIEAD